MEKTKYKKQWYNLRPLLGMANWAIFYCLIGPRQTGKSYAVCDFLTSQFVNKGIPFTWLRLTETQARKLLANNAEKLIDADIRRRYNLDLVTNGNNVYSVKREYKEVKKKNGTTETKSKIVEKKLMARVYALSTFYSDKGSLYDKDFLNDPNMRYNVAIDEFEREGQEANRFDIVYSLVNQLETLFRNTKERIKVFFMGNTLSEASDVLCAFNCIPEEYGIYKIKSKRCVIHNIEPSDEYKEMRKGCIADILLPQASTFTGKIDTDKALIDKSRLVSPSYIIKFTKDKKDWYTVWNSNIVAKYNGEKKPVVAMRPYLDEVYNTDVVKNMITLFDTRSLKFRNLICFKQFQSCMELLKPRK